MNYKKIFAYLWVLFIVIIGFHIALHFSYQSLGEETAINDWVAAVTGVVTIFGGLVGLGGLKHLSVTGVQRKIVIFFSLMLTSLGIGFFLWTYYAITAVGEDYVWPTLADYVWVVGTIFSIIGVFYALKIYKASISSSKLIVALLAFLALGAVVTSFIGYPSFSIEEGISMNETFFNFFYSISDLVMIALAILILTIAGGKIYKGLFIFTVGLLFQVTADIMFAIRDGAGILWQGDISDVMFSTSGFLMSIGVIYLIKEFDKNKLS